MDWQARYHPTQCVWRSIAY